MAKKNIFDWEKGAVLEEHSKKKHQILKAYFRKYLITRCQHRQQNKFRLVVVDAFAGGGLYTCGTYGSPLLLLDVLSKTTNEINLLRINKGLQSVDIECLFIFNDTSTEAIEKLKENIAPVLVQTEAETSNLSIVIEYLNDAFLTLYPSIKKRVLSAKCQNVFFNLDQNAYLDVPTQVIRDISHTWKKAEILLTFSITSLLAFLSPEKNKQGTPLEAEIRGSIDKISEDITLLETFA